MKQTTFQTSTGVQIFIDVKANKQLAEIKKLADSYFENNPAHKVKIDKRASHFHITIATRDLRKKEFCEAWKDFEGKVFQEVWAAQDLSILKHNGMTWDVLCIAKFGPTD